MLNIKYNLIMHTVLIIEKEIMLYAYMHPVGWPTIISGAHFLPWPLLGGATDICVTLSV